MKSKITLVLLVLFAFFSCDKEEGNGNYFDFGKEKEFYINNEYISSNEYLKFTISEISDSRCPAGVVCVWEGEAKVTLRVEAFPDQPINLSTYDNRKDTINNYVFELVDVLPYQKIDQEIKLEDYVVTLKVSQAY